MIQGQLRFCRPNSRGVAGNVILSLSNLPPSTIMCADLPPKVLVTLRNNPLGISVIMPTPEALVEMEVFGQVDLAPLNAAYEVYLQTLDNNREHIYLRPADVERSQNHQITGCILWKDRKNFKVTDGVLPFQPGNRFGSDLVFKRFAVLPPGSTTNTSDIDHNPYNFVSLPPGGPWLENPDPNTGKHRGHARWQPDLLHGHIDVTITARSPLFIPQWNGRDTGSSSPDFYRLCKRTETEKVEHYAIPGASLKGAVRSMVEALANDRFGILDDHKYYKMPIPYRRRAHNARVRPGLVLSPPYHVGKANYTNGEWTVTPIKYQEAGNRDPYRSNLLAQLAEHRVYTDAPILDVRYSIPDPVVERYNSNLDHPHYKTHYEDWNERYRTFKDDRKKWEDQHGPAFLEPKPPDKPHYCESLYCEDPRHLTDRFKQIREALELKESEKDVIVFFSLRERPDGTQEIDSFGRNMNYLWPSKYSIEDLVKEWYPPEFTDQGMALTKPLGLAELMFGFASDLEGQNSHPFRGKLSFEPWPAPFHETECSATVCRSLQITGRTGACGCRVSPAGKTEAGSAGEQPAKGYPAETHSDESPGRASGSSRRICAWSGTSEEISRCLGKLMLAGSQAAASLLRSCRCSNSTGDR